MIHPLQWAAVPLAVVLIAVLAWRGLLSNRFLRLGPLRDVPLSWFDFAAAILMWLGGQMIAMSVLRSSAGPDILTSTAPAAVAVRMLTLQLLGFGPAVLWFVIRCVQSEGGLRRAGIVPRRPLRDLAVAVLAFPVMMVLVTAVMTLSAAAANALGHPPPPVQHELLNTYTEPMPPAVFALLLLSTVVLAPILEEFLWRGLLQTVALQALGHTRRWWVILPAAAAFGLIHAAAVPVTALPALVLLGVIFGYLYERTGSLWPGIMVHAGFNAINVATVLAADAGAAVPAAP